MNVSLVASVGAKLDIPPLTLPFLIMTLQVPKNFIKKLIGYQVRVLSELRKRYEVEFEYELSLVTDFVFSINETSPLYVFGRGSDVVKVCQIL